MPKVTFSKDIKARSFYFKKKVVKIVKNKRNIIYIICVDSVYTEHKRYAKHCG